MSYDLPYTLVPAGSKVLIVGAGMGNDVAAALRNRMGEVDAVEIDPTIQRLGIENHPEKPYADDRVNPIVDDARSFFTKSDNKYDVIAFGLLDSHTLLSSLTSVRLDSFVYTIESFQQVRDHLKDDGIAVLTFATSTDWIEERLGRMLIDVFGVEHVTVHYSGLGTTFVAGNITPHQKIQTGLSAWNPDPFYDNLPLSTDDWPYLYLKNRTIPSAYWQSLLLVSIAGLALIIRSFPEALKPNWHFWLLGAAFLLIEFKSITELALLFGTTWLVNALAISGVLIMILFANLFVLWRKQLNLWVTYIFLFLSLALIYFIPLDVFSELDSLIRAVLSTVYLSFPLFFAGIIFAESLRRAGNTSRPLASNLSGTMVGGVLEYGSLWFGIKSLYIIAGVLYLGAMLTLLFRKNSSS
jgi:SAM-dependent methyltransferase